MMTRSTRRPWLVAAALAGLAWPCALAGEEESLEKRPREPIELASGAVVFPQGVDPDRFVTKSGFGTDDLHVVNVPFSSFFPRFSSASYTTLCCITEGARWPTAGDHYLVGTIDAGLIPNGADLEEVAFYLQDSSTTADENLRGLLCRTWVDADGSDPGQDCPAQATTFGGLGNTVISFDPNIPVLYRYDVDQDGIDEVVNYVLFVEFGIDGTEVYDGSIRLRQARLLYRRRISPAPAQATFNDVAPGDFAFQHIEALAASGITGGCGGGNYCPNAPLTRAQMAVFLAKALGLHWPAF